MQIKIGAIADDFTGATDLAVMMRRTGMNVVITVGVPAGKAAEKADAVVIALKTRNLPAPEAVSQSLSALRRLQSGGGAEHIFFKYCSTFDSTDEGNIGPVTDALMAEMGIERTIAVPAFPENGRQMVFGHLFVNGRLLSESSMANHPLTPMHDPDIVRVLSRQRAGPVGLVPKMKVDMGPEAARSVFDSTAANSVVLCDAIDDNDLNTLAVAFSDLQLATGGSAFGGAIAAVWAGKWLDGMQANKLQRRNLEIRPIVLSGSASEATQRQVRQALNQGYFGVKVDAEEAQEPEALANRILGELECSNTPRAIVYATDSPENVRGVQARLGRQRAGEILEIFFGRFACEAKARGYNAFVVAGGETSGSVVRSLQVDEMLVEEEICPGVPWVRSGDTWLALKSGNFGDDEFFDRAIGLLQGRSQAHD